MYLVKLKNGHFAPYDSVDHEESSKIKEGEVIKGVKSRNYEFHKKAFALLKLGFDNQDKYPIFNVYRKVIIIRSGYCQMAEGKDGKIHPIPDSLSFENMSAKDFEKWYDSALDIISKDLETAPDVINAEVAGFY